MPVIFWDFDGTLVYSPSLWSGNLLNALNDITTEHDLTLWDFKPYTASGYFTWDNQTDDLTHIKGDMWWEYMNTHFYDTYISLGVSHEIAVKAVDKFKPKILDKNNYTVYSDVVYTLKKCKEKGYTNVVLSNNYPELEEVIAQLELSPYFDEYVVSAKIGLEKPKSGIFEYAKSLFPNENDFIMVGDNPYADILGAKKHGMKTVYVHKGYFNEADYCFDDLKSILNIL